MRIKYLLTGGREELDLRDERDVGIKRCGDIDFNLELITVLDLGGLRRARTLGEVKY